MRRDVPDASAMMQAGSSAGARSGPTRIGQRAALRADPGDAPAPDVAQPRCHARDGAVAICETAYVGVRGTTELAAIALVFPMVMLMQMLSAGALGGGVSSAISRALGAGEEARAEGARPTRP